MRLNWERWFYEMADRCARHVGTSLLTCGALSIKHWQDLSGNLIGDVLVSILAGAIIPTVALYLQNKGLPKDEDEKTPIDNDPDRTAS